MSKLRNKFNNWRRHRNMCKEMATAIENGDLVISGFEIRGLALVGAKNIRVYNVTVEQSEEDRPFMILTNKRPTGFSDESEDQYDIGVRP